MPKIVEKEETLNGEAVIIRYNHRDTYFLRVKRGGKRYTNFSLKTTDILTARKEALSAYVEVQSEAPKSRTRKYSFEKGCAEFLEWKYKQANRKQISVRSASTYEQRVYQRIIPYAKFAGVKSVNDIDTDTFETYKDYYLDVKTKGKWKSAASGLSASTINGDINTLKELLNWLIKKRILDPRKLGEIPRARDDKNYRDESNPAFFPEEFARMKDELFKFDQNIEGSGKFHNISDEEMKWKKRWFINYILFQYQLGSRPHETTLIRMRDIDFKKEKDGKLYGIVNISPATKRGKRTAIMNGNTLRKVKYHANKGIKIRNAQIEMQNKKISEEYANYKIEGLMKKFPFMNPETRQIDLLEPAGDDDLLMMNPFLRDRKMYHSEHIRAWWKEILGKCDFKTNYTIYSLRSTHITHALLKKMSIRQVAENCGTSQTEIERTYQRLNNLLNMRDLGFFKDRPNDDLLA